MSDKASAWASASDHDHELSDRFSITISALDLATTPFALERAQQQADTTQDTLLTYFLDLETTPFALEKQKQDTPLTSFLENYRPYPGFLRKPFPFLHRALQNYEIRTLKPFIRTAAQSQSILIQIIQDDCNLDGVLSRRRVVPIEIQHYDFILRVLRRIFFLVCNRHRSLEALDLATSDSGAIFKFDQDYDTIWKISHFPLNRLPWMIRRWWRILPISALLTIFGALPFLITYLSLPPFLDFTTLDRRLCGSVTPGPYPCMITPNSDVAGIGGRSALYMQIFLLAVLLPFSPKEATSVSWTLVFTSTALALSGLIATATSKLTLYHVTLIAKLQSLPVVILTIVEIFPPRQRGPYIFLLHLFRLAVSLAILIWFTVKAPCFGNQPECNAYVVTHGLFSSEMAIASATRTSSLSVAAMTFTVRLVLSAEDITLALQSLFSSDAERKWNGLPTGLMKSKKLVSWKTLLIWAVASFFNDNSRPPFVKLKTRSAQMVSREPLSLPHPVTAMITKSSQPSSAFLYIWSLPDKLYIFYQTASVNIWSALCYPKVWRFMIAFAVGGVLVNGIEATILSNTVDDEETVWTYGQVLAVILTAIPVVQVLQLIGLASSPRKKQMKNVCHKEKVL